MELVADTVNTELQDEELRYTYVRVWTLELVKKVKVCTCQYHDKKRHAIHS